MPVFAEQDSWDFVRSHGWLIAEAAIDVLEAAEEVQASPIRVEAESLYVPIENVAYRLLGPFGIFDLDLDDTTFDPTLCPAADRAADIGCIETRTFQARIGPAAFMAVPGELLPELFWGFPDADPRWADEAANPQARGTGQSAYFLQHPRACDAVDYTACSQSTGDIDGCDCKQMHAVPYRLNDDPAVRPMIEGLAPDPEVRFRATLGMIDNYLSYIVPEPDFTSAVSLLTDDGDHYEDTVSPSASFATQLQAAQARIRDRW